MSTQTIPRVEATIRYLTTEEGGRHAPVATGYRGQFHYEGENDIAHDAVQIFPDVPEGIFIPLGERIGVLLQFGPEIWQSLHRKRMCIGTRFQIQEGRRIVARGVVTKVTAEEEADS